MTRGAAAESARRASCTRCAAHPSPAYRSKLARQAGLACCRDGFASPGRHGCNDKTSARSRAAPTVHKPSKVQGLHPRQYESTHAPIWRAHLPSREVIRVLRASLDLSLLPSGAPRAASCSRGKARHPAAVWQTYAPGGSARCAPSQLGAVRGETASLSGRGLPWPQEPAFGGSASFAFSSITRGKPPGRTGGVEASTLSWSRTS